MRVRKQWQFSFWVNYLFKCNIILLLQNNPYKEFNLILLLLKCCIDACSSSTSSVDTSGNSGLFQRRHIVRQPNAIPDEVTWTAAFNPANKALLIAFCTCSVVRSHVETAALRCLLSVCSFKMKGHFLWLQQTIKLSRWIAKYPLKQAWAHYRLVREDAGHVLCCYLGLLTLHMGSVKPTV